MPKTISRHLQRQWAVQLLYQIDMTEMDFPQAWRQFLKIEPEAQKAFYCRFLVEGVLEKEESLDKIIISRLKNWSRERLSRVDLSIIRLGLFEIFFCPEIPGAVAVNEAVELGKKFSSLEAGKFINGILGHFAAEKK